MSSKDKHSFVLPVKLTSCDVCGNEDTRKLDRIGDNSEKYWCPKCNNEFEPRYEELEDWVNENNE